MKKLIVGNWKSNKSNGDLDNWFEVFNAKMIDAGTKMGTNNNIEVSIAPPYPLINSVNDFLNEAKFDFVKLSLQDISPFPAGSYTGAVNSQNLRGYKVKYAIVGHSERRQYFHETSRDISLKVEQALANNIIPIVCVDEPYLEEQAKAIDSSLLEKCVVAYEPLSAIGTGKSSDVSNVARVKSHTNELFGDVPVIYGGSVTDKNVNEFLLVADGVLPGGASLSATTFGDLIINSIV